MKYLLCTCLAVCASLNAVAARQGDDDAKAIQGDWKPVKGELGGLQMTDAVLKTISLRLDDGKYEVFVNAASDKGTYELDPGAKPRSITVTGTAGPNKGRTFPAIYELDGDTLRICYDLSGAKRPTEFKTVEGTKLYLVTYRRQTK